MSAPMINVTLPDGTVLEVPPDSTLGDVAAAIGPGLAKAAVAGQIDGETVDLGARLSGEAAVRILTERDEDAPGGDVALDLLAIDEALDRLAEVYPEQARVVELRFFGGLTIEETAAATAVSPATVKRQWTMARAWLRREVLGGS